MGSIQKRSLSLLLEFMFKEKNLNDAVKFHNELLDLFFAYHGCNNIEEMRIMEPMDLKEMWLKGRFLLHWVLFDVNKEAISTKIADDIFNKFSAAYGSDRVLIIQ